MRRGVAALGAAAVDAVVLGTGIMVGWLSISTVLLAVWLQTAVILVAVPVVLLTAAARAPRRPDVDAGIPRLRTGHRPTAPVYVRFVTAFFTAHYGVFTVVIGAIVLSFARLLGAGSVGVPATLPPTVLAVLVGRAVVANVPTTVADGRFLATDGSTLLADRATVVVRRAYVRIIPLYVGLMVVIGPQLDGPGRAAELSVIATVVALTFIASLWRYPTTSELQATVARRMPRWSPSPPPG